MLKDKTILLDELKIRISEALKMLCPEKVILFGSYAWGQPTRDSDIDIIVVLADKKMTNTYHEKMSNRLIVRRALDELNRDYSLDVLVYTTAEWQQFRNLHSSFSEEILSSGVEV
jgi:predicted nucleotidyltransferase